MHRLHCKELESLKLTTRYRYPPLFLRILIKKNSNWDTVHIRARIGQTRLVFDAFMDPASCQPVGKLSSSQDCSL